MDTLDEFIESRRAGLAGRTATILRQLAHNSNIETVERELHRIVGTCGSYGLIDGSHAAADLLARVRDDQVISLITDLNALAEIFTLSAPSE